MLRGRNQKPYNVGEDTKIAINLMMQKLMVTADQKVLKFSASYTTEERAYIHDLAAKLGIKSRSQGRGINRFLTVYKPEGVTIIHTDNIIKLQKLSKQTIYNCIRKFPLTKKESRDLLPFIQKEKILESNKKSINQAKKKPLNKNIPLVPQLKINSDTLTFRKKLTIMSKKEEILETINSNRVVIIAGETGCGKTTQIPQFILENCQEKNQMCRIICTQPRRLSVISVAERVAFERGEKVGQTFGYQIRLESKVTSKTLLTYCTNGILLRTLISEDSPLSVITHIIVDEVHERDRFCDFLLIALKDALEKYKSLKIILMSATIDTSVFVKYFNNCPVINIPGKLYDIDIYFLEDVLKITNYMTKEMFIKKKELTNSKINYKGLKLLNHHESQLFEPNKFVEKFLSTRQSIQNENELIKKVELESWLIEEMDKAIADAWLYGEEDRFTQILYLIHSKNVSVDYQHSKTYVTTLMIAAGRGYVNIVQHLLNLGSDLNLRSSNDWTVYDWAKNMNQVECAKLIEAYMIANDYAEQEDKSSEVKNILITEDNKKLLDIYHSTFNDENIDYDLLLELIIHIHLKMPMGSILIFLPGYEDIITMKEKISGEDKINYGNNYNIYILHSNMEINDQKRVFKSSPKGCRKIILSTNIAETSITIDDVVYVIDCGKVKEKSFDAISGVCTLQSNWISQACAKQRTGRAGRCQKGKCYRIYSSVCFNNMQLYQTPEILRLPLQQLCLYTKHLASRNTPIANFLERAIEPPSNFVIKNAVELLKKIDALDPWEDLTELGSHLLDLPIEPRLGKMLLYAVVLKCLDPILTIVCSLSYKDPFIIPSHLFKKQAVMLARKKFAADSYSDHMAILRAFEMWMNARTYVQKRIFCEKNFISFPVMEMIAGMRIQLLAQLKISGFVKTKEPGDINNLNSNSKNWAVVKAALTAGFYPNLIRVDRKYNQLKTQKEAKVRFHPSSIFKDFSKSLKKSSIQPHKINTSSLSSDWILYEEMSRFGRSCCARTLTLVNSITVAIFSGSAKLSIDEYKFESESDSNNYTNYEELVSLKVDDWIVFKADPKTAQLIFYVRQKWNALFLRCMKYPHKVMSQIDEQIIKTLVTVITNEEQVCKLQQPSDVNP